MKHHSNNLKKVPPPKKKKERKKKNRRNNDNKLLKTKCLYRMIKSCLACFLLSTMSAPVSQEKQQ